MIGLSKSLLSWMLNFQVRKKRMRRTKDRLAAIEEELAKCKVGAATSTRTREKLAEAERQLRLKTSTSTRERLAEVERQLSQKTLKHKRKVGHG